MHLYKSIDPAIATVVLKGMARHLQYLTPESAVFALTDEGLDNETRSAMGLKVLSIYLTTEDLVFQPKLPEDILGRPNFTVDADIWEDKQSLPDLTLFLAEGSLLVFHYLNLLSYDKLSWLEDPVDFWHNSFYYQKLHSWVHNLEVTNDSSERMIKLVTDYMDHKHSESSFQDQLLTISRHRMQYRTSRQGKFNKKELSDIE